MSQEFIKAGLRGDWLSWIGQPLLYDGGLCVNRTPEEHAYHNSRHKYTPLCV